MEGSNKKPADLQNILQGDDSNHRLNSSLNDTIPTDFDEPGEQYNGLNSSKFMDSRNNGDHDFSGRFNPYGGLPNASSQASDPFFTRQLAPLKGGKHVDDNDESFETGDAANDPIFKKVDPNASVFSQNSAPVLGQKRMDEPDEDRIGLDPSRDHFLITETITTSTTAENDIRNLKDDNVAKATINNSTTNVNHVTESTTTTNTNQDTVPDLIYIAHSDTMEPTQHLISHEIDQNSSDDNSHLTVSDFKCTCLTPQNLSDNIISTQNNNMDIQNSHNIDASLVSQDTIQDVNTECNCFVSQESGQDSSSAPELSSASSSECNCVVSQESAHDMIPECNCIVISQESVANKQSAQDLNFECNCFVSQESVHSIKPIQDLYYVDNNLSSQNSNHLNNREFVQDFNYKCNCLNSQESIQNNNYNENNINVSQEPTQEYNCLISSQESNYDTKAKEDLNYVDHNNLHAQNSTRNLTFENDPLPEKAILPKPVPNLKSQRDPTTANPFNFNKPDGPTKCFKLNYQQPLGLNTPSILISGLENMGIKYLIMSGLFSLYLGQSNYGIISLLVANIMGVMAFYMLSSSVLRAINWQVEKINGAHVLSKKRQGETMEWFNCFVEKVWRSIDPQVFAVVEDILEDTISRVAPKIIKGVKVGDFDLGVQSIRIERMNIFPPSYGQPLNCIASIFECGEAEFTLGVDPNNTTVTTFKPHVASPPGFSIRFQSTLNASAEVRGELTKLMGSIRFKIVTAPEPPFISRVTFSFLQAPEIETAVMPISNKFNIMRLPMLKTLVNQGVKLGFSSLVSPNSVSVDINPIMIGAMMDTNAIGVVKVKIRQMKAICSKKGDPESQDSFVTFSLSDRETHNIKSTRVLSKTPNPIWNEKLYQLVTIEDIKKEVYLNIKVWEADKVKSDTLLGSISTSVKNVVLATFDEYENVSSWCNKERIMFDGWAPIDGKTGSEARLLIDFKISFHPKYITPIPSPRDHARTEKAKRDKAKQKRKEKERKEREKQEKKRLKQTRKEACDVSSGILLSPVVVAKENPYQNLKDENGLDHVHSMDDRPNLENGGAAILSDNDSDLDKTELVPNQPEGFIHETVLDSDDESDDSSEFELGEQVSPLHTSGILSVTIVKAKDLEVIDPEVISFKKRRHPYKLQKAVSPYADVYIDDNKVFRTRSKMCTANPTWNAVSECFLKNYNTSFIRISVKNHLDLEDDPVIGTTVLKISDLFLDKTKKSKESERWISLSDGIGYGKVLISLKYKPIKLVLPRQLSGADVGTLIIDSIKLDIKSPMNPNKILSTKAHFSINVEPVITRELKSNLLEKRENSIGWFKNNLYFPLMMRYRSALYIHLSQGSSSHKVTACLWMKEIYDTEWQDLSLGLFPYKEEDAIDELPWGEEGPCGKILIHLKFVPGFSPAHTELPQFTTDMLGADPFQNDDTRDKAHLLVRQEGTENYAINIPPEKKMNSITSPATVEPSHLVILPGANTGEENLFMVQDVTTPYVMEKRPEHPIFEEARENNNVISSNQAISNADDRRERTSNVTFDTQNNENWKEGSSLYNQRVSTISTGAAAEPDHRRSYASASGTSTIENEATRTLTGTTFNSGDRRTPVSTPTNPSSKLNELVEVETVGYLQAMEEDLENSKIHKYSFMRKLSKGRNNLLKKVKSLRQGYNSQARANKAIVEEA